MFLAILGQGWKWGRNVVETDLDPSSPLSRSQTGQVIFDPQFFPLVGSQIQSWSWFLISWLSSSLPLLTSFLAKETSLSFLTLPPLPHYIFPNLIGVKVAFPTQLCESRYLPALDKPMCLLSSQNLLACESKHQPPTWGGDQIVK